MHPISYRLSLANHAADIFSKFWVPTNLQIDRWTDCGWTIEPRHWKLTQKNLSTEKRNPKRICLVRFTFLKTNSWNNYFRNRLLSRIRPKEIWFAVRALRPGKYILSISPTRLPRKTSRLTVWFKLTVAYLRVQFTRKANRSRWTQIRSIRIIHLLSIHVYLVNNSFYTWHNLK